MIMILYMYTAAHSQAPHLAALSCLIMVNMANKDAFWLCISVFLDFKINLKMRLLSGPKKYIGIFLFLIF